MRFTIIVGQYFGDSSVLGDPLREYRKVQEKLDADARLQDLYEQLKGEACDVPRPDSYGRCNAFRGHLRGSLVVST